MIRPATSADAAAVARVQVDSWDGTYRGLIPDQVIDALTPERRTDQWERFLANPAGRTLLVAEHDGVVGMASLGPARGEAGDVGEIYAIYVTPDHWDHGHGRDLIVEAERLLAAAGHTSAVLWVLVGNDRGIGFYEKAGWQPDGHTRIEVMFDESLSEVRYRRDLGAAG